MTVKIVCKIPYAKEYFLSFEKRPFKIVYFKDEGGGGGGECSSRRQGDDLLEGFSRGPSKLNHRESFPDLLNDDAGLEEDVVGGVHPRDDVALAAADPGQGGNAAFGKNLHRAT